METKNNKDTNNSRDNINNWDTITSKDQNSSRGVTISWMPLGSDMPATPVTAETECALVIAKMSFRQWWAKLLRLLTVNSLSYFVKIKY